MQKIYNIVVLTICLLVTFAKASQAALTIAEKGKSTFTIVVPEQAPSSVTDAAQELQRCIEIATQTTLPIKRNSENISGPMISLGATRQAAAAQIAVDDIPDEGFRIVTQNNNLYILGLDTVARIGPAADSWGWRSENYEYEVQPSLPGQQLTKNGGFSNGTANGVYTFLEDFLDVRWLLPGEMGRDVPRKSAFTIDEINRTEAPQFVYRVMGYLFPTRQKSAAVLQWGLRQKLGFSFRLNHEHYWSNTVPLAQFDKHPEWFAMINGKRHRPTGIYDYKLETTNQELVNYYAQRAIAALKADPVQNTYSLSPSDGRGWSQSSESKALYGPPPAESTFPSVTPLILKFYRDVANIVAKEYPQGKLAGYIYQDFALPPTKGDATIPANVTPVIT